MEYGFAFTVLSLVVVAVTVFLCLLAALYFLRWLFEEWRLAGPRAIERMRKRLVREQERSLYQQQLRELEEEARLAGFGKRLIDEISSPLYHQGEVVFGRLRAVRTGLSNYASVCFHTLQYLAASCDEAAASPYELADLSPDRHKARLQVVAIAAAGLEVLEVTNKDILVDSRLVVWKLNLERVLRQTCPSCPVVMAPELYPSACPVMMMACEVKNNEDKKRAPQQS